MVRCVDSRLHVSLIHTRSVNWQVNFDTKAARKLADAKSGVDRKMVGHV